MTVNAEQHFLQGADLVDNFVEHAVGLDATLALNHKQLVVPDENHIEFVVVLDLGASVNMHPNGDIIRLKHRFD